jgi:hypothetical protein
VTLEQAVEWYVHLAKQPGWKFYVWERVQQMAADYPALYGELPQRLTAEMKKPD